MYISGLVDHRRIRCLTNSLIQQVCEEIGRDEPNILIKVEWHII
jgi:hypothetical protein